MLTGLFHIKPVSLLDVTQQVLLTRKTGLCDEAKQTPRTSRWAGGQTAAVDVNPVFPVLSSHMTTLSKELQPQLDEKLLFVMNCSHTDLNECSTRIKINALPKNIVRYYFWTISCVSCLVSCVGSDPAATLRCVCRLDLHTFSTVWPKADVCKC